jgi:molybdopterin converting factor small subunit
LPDITGTTKQPVSEPEDPKALQALKKKIPSLESDLDQYFEKINQRSESLVQGILDENNIIEQALSSRVDLFGKYGVAQYDQTLTQYEKELAALEFRLNSESEAINMAYVKNSAQLREQRQRIEEDDKISVDAKLEATRLLDDQLLLQEQVKQQALYEIQREGSALRTQAAIDEAQRTIELQGQIQNNYLNTAQVGIGALTSLLGGSKKAGKALRIVQAGISAFQVYANHQAAAAQVLATPPGPVLNPTLIPLAASISLAGKVGAAAIIAGAAAETFSGGGGGSVGISGGSSSSSGVTPQLPQAPEQVQSLSIIGQESIVRELQELDAADGLIPPRIMLRYLRSVEGARRIGG